MKLACPTCRKTLTVADDRVRLMIHCPGCGESMTVPDVDDVEILEPWDGSEEHPLPTVSGRGAGAAATESPGTRICPTCGETIRAVAQKCRYCGAFLGGLGPDGLRRSGVWRDGDRLVITPGAKLPFVCIRTNQPADVWIRLRPFIYPRMIPFFLLFGLCGLSLFVLLVVPASKQIDIEVGLCHKRFVRRRRAIVSASLLALAGAAMIIGGIAMRRPPDWPDWLVIAGAVTICAAIVLGIPAAQVVSLVRITDNYAWLKGAHPDFLAGLPDFPGEA